VEIQTQFHILAKPSLLVNTAIVLQSISIAHNNY